MYIWSDITNSIKMTLGEADCNNLPPLLFKSVRKNTKVELNIDPFTPTDSNERWAGFELDGSQFEIGEHLYFVEDDLGNLIERGILIVKDGNEKETVEYHGSLEGEKGEYRINP